MKAILLTVTLVFFITLRAGAQLTLDAGSYPISLTGTDTLRVTNYNSSFPSLLPSTAATWDMTILTDTIPFFLDYRVPVIGYDYADSNLYNIGAYSYRGSEATSIAISGLIAFNVGISKVSYSLTSITAGANDTLYVPSQTALYSTPLIKIAFPCTYGTVWQSTYRADVSFELSYGAFSFLHEPGFKRTYTERSDTVTGWGHMRLRNVSGGPSDYFDVLQVQSTTITTDSFFLSGTPATPIILTAFSLQQGKKDTTYIQRYYRQHEVTPMATVEFTDATFTQPFRATTHMQNLVKASVQEIAAAPAFTLYPNPSSSRSLQLQLPGSNGRYTYSVTDIAGKCLHTGSLHGANPDHHITLPAALSAGIYYFRLFENSAMIGARPFTISE